MTKAGLETVLMANRAALVRFLRTRGAGEEAEDLSQELWIRAQAIEAGELRDPLAFLFRMADNLLIDRRRSAVRAQRREQGWRAAEQGDDDGAAPNASVERVLIGRQRLDAVERELAGLGERTAAIFRRFRVDGVGQRQIAAEQGISVSAVEKHLRKCYRLLVRLKAAEDAENDGGERQDIEGISDVRD